MGRYVNNLKKGLYEQEGLPYNPSIINQSPYTETQKAGLEPKAISQDWNLGNGSNYALKAQDENPTGVIKDVYDLKTGQKVGAFNTQTGTKYYQSKTPEQIAQEQQMIVDSK